MPEPFEAQYVERGIDAAIARAKPFGLLKDPNGQELTAQQRAEIIKLVTERMEKTAVSTKRNGGQVRWNTRAIQFFSEVVGVGILARRHHGESPHGAAEIDSSIKKLKQIGNSFAHRDK